MVAMAFELPPLPYPKNALEPHISERTMDFHHGRHHQAYVTNLNNLVKGSPAEQQSLEEIIRPPTRTHPRRASSTMPRKCGTTPSSGIA
jgi:superoxide dismutase